MTKIKFDIAALTHTINASHMILESDKNNSINGQSILSNTYENEYIIFDEIFPIKSNNELEDFEKKIENDKQYRLYLVCYCHLLLICIIYIMDIVTK